MDKGRTVLALVLFLCLAMAAAMFSGCGSGGAARIENPLEYFFQARENMQTVASFRISGEMEMTMSGMPGEDAISVDYDLFLEQKINDEMLARMDMQVKGPDEFATVAYIAGDRMYMEMPDGMWVYEEVDLSSDLTDLGQSMSPQYVMDLIDMAESAEVVDEDGNSITYNLVLDFDKLINEMDTGEMQRQLEDEGIPAEELDVIMDMVEHIFSAMEIEMTVEKKSGLPERLKMRLEIDFSSLAAMFPDDPPPEDAGMVMDADFKISDYGKSFDIQLPEEAEDAIPIEELESLTET